MNTKFLVIFFLLFINYSILADESTLIEADFVDLTFTTQADEDLDEEEDDDFVDEGEDLEEEKEDEDEDAEVEGDDKKAVETVPNGEPVENGRLSSDYGWRKDPFTGRQQHHSGIDIAAEKGSEVKAVSSGKVIRAGNHGKYGNLVEIDHGNEYKTRYGHNEEILVQVGDTVKQGDPIAHVGSSGRSTGPHLHYEVLHQNTKVDPAEFLEPEVKDVTTKEEEKEIDEEEDEVYEDEVYEDEVYEAEVYDDDFDEEFDEQEES